LSSEKEQIYSAKTIESIIENPDGSWKNQFKEMIISMIASNKNDLLWYANFLSRCEYEFHLNESFVSSVYFNGNNFVIVINPVILGLIAKDQVIAILKHSAGHMMNHHFSRFSHDESVDKKAVEVAMDIVINGNREVPYIKDLPRTESYKDSPIKALFYQTLTQEYGIQNYETGREFEYYAELITEAQKEDECRADEDENGEDTDDIEDDTNSAIDSKQDSSENSEEDELNCELNMQSNTSENAANSSDLSDGSGAKDSSTSTSKKADSLSEKILENLKNGDCDIDSHEYGQQRQETVGLDENLLKSFMDTSLKEMIEDSTSFARGFTPGAATKALSRIEKRKAHKDWKKIFNKKMRNSLSNSMRYREPNKSRQHPIYPDDLDLYGYSPAKKPKLAVVLDVSGSVKETLLVALMSQIQAIQKRYSIKSVTLLQVDAEIKTIEKFGVRDKFIVRHGSGGTVMEPGFKALLNQPSRDIPDMIICATDGDVEEKFEHVKIPNTLQVIWLINQEGKLSFDTSNYPKQQMHVIKFSM